jgi:chromosome segregation ATPase
VLTTYSALTVAEKNHIESNALVMHLQESYETLHVELEDKATQIVTLQISFEALQAQQQARINSLENDTAVLQKQISEVVLENRQANDILAELTVEVELLRRLNIEYECELQQLVQNHSSTVQDLSDQVNSYENECEDLRCKLLSESHESTSRHSKELNELQSRLIDEYSLRLDQYVVEISALRTELETTTQQLLELSHTNSSLNSALITSQQESEFYIKRNEGLKAELTTQIKETRRLARSRDGVLCLQNEVDELKKSVDKISASKLVSEAQLVELQAVVNREQDKLVYTEDAYTSVSLQYDQVNEEKTQLVQQLQQAVSEWKIKESSLQQVENKMLILHQQYDEQTTEYISKINILHNEVTVYRQDIESLSCEKQDISSQLENTLQQLSNSSIRILALETDIASLTTDFQNQLSELSLVYQQELHAKEVVTHQLVVLREAYEQESQSRIQAEGRSEVVTQELSSAEQ